MHALTHSLTHSLLSRRQPGSPVNDQLVQMQNYMRFLPEVLRPKREGGLAPHHRMYPATSSE